MPITYQMTAQLRTAPVGRSKAIYWDAPFIDLQATLSPVAFNELSNIRVYNILGRNTPTVTVSAVAPTVNDDSTLGFEAGDIWINTTDQLSYILIDATAGSAFWQTIWSNTMQRTERAAATLPQTAQAPLFTISGGKIRVLGLIGEVTTAIQVQANATKLVANPDVGADVDLCTAIDITGDPIGNMYEISGTLSEPMLSSASGALSGQAVPVLVYPGSIDLNCAASNTGQVRWTLLWVAVEEDAQVVPA